MDWQVFFTTFTMIFIAEIGDKSQFVAFAAAADSKSTISVLLAFIFAMSAAGLIGVLAGKYLGDFLSPQYIKWISGTMFIGIGAWTLFGK